MSQEQLGPIWAEELRTLQGALNLQGATGAHRSRRSWCGTASPKPCPALRLIWIGNRRIGINYLKSDQNYQRTTAAAYLLFPILATLTLWNSMIFVHCVHVSDFRPCPVICFISPCPPSESEGWCNKGCYIQVFCPHANTTLMVTKGCNSCQGHSWCKRREQQLLWRRLQVWYWRRCSLGYDKMYFRR